MSSSKIPSTFSEYNNSLLREKEVILKDITLREGEQTADIAFSSREKLELARALSDAGIKEIQCGFSYSAIDREVVRALKNEGCKAKLELLSIGFSEDWKEQITKSMETGCDDICFIFRCDSDHLHEMGLVEEEAIRRVGEISAYACSLGAEHVIFCPSFVTRAETRFALEMMQTAKLYGADEIVLPDSTGIMNPEGYGKMVQLVKSHLKMDIAVHCHNDFGFALANSLEGLKAGAKKIEASVAGLGERAGNAAIEELAIALKLLFDVDTGIDIVKLVRAERKTLSSLKFPIPKLKPIIGENIFAQKLDVHVMVTRSKPWLHEPFEPATVGARRILVIGKGSGGIAVSEKANQLSLPISEAVLPILVEKVNQFAEENKRSLTDQEFIALLDSVVKKIP